MGAHRCLMVHSGRTANSSSQAPRHKPAGPTRSHEIQKKAFKENNSVTAVPGELVSHGYLTILQIGHVAEHLVSVRRF